MKSNYSIVIMSCDSYSDIWSPLVQTFERFWSDCPFDVYLCSETKDFNHDWIKNIKVGRRMDWGEMMLEVLKHITTPNIIYMQEDYLLKSPINNSKLFALLEDFESMNAAYLRLFPWPNPDVLMENREDLGYITKESAYRTSLQCAVWDVSVLRELSRADENGWDFEAKSIERTKKYDRPFLSVNADVDYASMNDHTHVIDYFATGVLHGKWMREAVFYFKKIGIEINPGKRGVLTRWDYWYRHQCKIESFKKKSFYSILNSFFKSDFIINMHNKYISLRGALK